MIPDIVGTKNKQTAQTYVDFPTDYLNPSFTPQNLYSEIKSGHTWEAWV